MEGGGRRWHFLGAVGGLGQKGHSQWVFSAVGRLWASFLGWNRCWGTSLCEAISRCLPVLGLGSCRPRLCVTLGLSLLLRASVFLLLFLHVS